MRLSYENAIKYAYLNNKSKHEIKLLQQAKKYRTEILKPLENDLINAIKDHDLYKVQEYIDKGGDVNIKDDKGNPVLVLAVQEANLYLMTDIIKLLIENGADVDSSNDKNKITPLILATLYDIPYIVEILLENGANINLEIDNPKIGLIDLGGINAKQIANENKHFNILNLLNKYDTIY